MPLAIDPQVLEQGAADAAEGLCLIGVPGPVCDVLRDVLPALVGWIATEVEGGGQARAKLAQLMLASADAAADAAEKAKGLP